MKGLITKIFFAFIFFTLINPESASASEGFTEMRSTIGEDTRCRADSHLMQDNNYLVLISCRDLIYPATSVVTTYIVWATPVGGDVPKKLGPLEYGRVDLKTKEAFSALFVTPETNKNIRQPEGGVVMRGTIEPYPFLQKPSTPTPTPTVSDQNDGENTDGEEVVSTENMTTRQKLIVAFKKAGLAAAFALIALVGLIFVVTRSRG